MTRRVQFQRSSITGNIPSRLQAGTPAFNWADKKMYVGGPGDTPDFALQKIDDWNTQLVYRDGDFVVYEGDLWRANVDVPANVGFRVAEWDQLTDVESGDTGQRTVTGVVEGGQTSLIDSRNIQIAAGVGIVVNREDPTNEAATVVTWGDFAVNFSPSVPSTKSDLVVGLDETGAVNIFEASTEAQRKYIYLAHASFDGSTLDIFRLIDGRIYSARTVDAGEDLYREVLFPAKIDGGVLSAGGGVTLDITSPTTFGRDWGGPEDPNIAEGPASQSAGFDLIWTGTVSAAPGVTNVPTDQWDQGGTLTNLNAGEAVVHRLSVDRAGRYYLSYGTKAYANLSEAIQNFWKDAQPVLPSFTAELGAVAVVAGATDLTDRGQARILQVLPVGSSYPPASEDDLSQYYRLDGTDPLTADLNMGGQALDNGFVDGEKVPIQPNVLTPTGELPSSPRPRELQINKGDAKVFVESDVVADRIEVFDLLREYKVDDACYSNNILYRCIVDTVAGDTPPSASWQSIGATVDLNNAIIREPGTDTRNTIDLDVAGDFKGLTINPNASQTKDLLTVGKAVIDRYGMGRGSYGGQVIRVNQASHGFSAIGQAVAFSNPNWIRADAASQNNSGRAIAVVHEIIDANNLDIQISGTIVGLQNTAFVGGVIQVGEVYFVSATSPGLLTNTPPNAPDFVDAVLYTVGPTEGIQLTSSVLGSGSGVGGGATTFTVGQTAHGFLAADVGRPIHLDEADGLWKFAAASDLSTAGVAVIDSLIDANTFSASIAGYVDDISATAFVGGVAPTAGKFYYVDQTGPGLLTEIAPDQGENRNALFLALSPTEGLVMPYEPEAPTTTSATSMETVDADDPLNPDFWRVQQEGEELVFTWSADLTERVIQKEATPTKPEALITMQQAFELLYPIGTLYSNGATDTDPATLLGFGTWIPYAEGRALVGIGGSRPDVGVGFGADTRGISAANMPPHTHWVDPPNATTSSNGAHTHTYTNTNGGTVGTSGSTSARTATKTSSTSSAGAHTHTLNIPGFSSGSAGSGAAFDVTQLSQTAAIWIRTA